MAEVIRMPKMSDTMKEGVIASWLVKVGDQVSSGDILAEVETDKATMELESYEDGTILYIGVEAGEAVEIDGIIAVIGEEGEDYQSLLSGAAAPSAPAAEAAPVEVQEEAAAPAAPAIDTSSIPAAVVRMPKMSDTMKEGVIAAWLVKVGDEIASGDVIAEVETDKATMELESYDDGTLLYIGAEAGQAVAIDGVIAIIGEAGTDFQPLLDAAAAPAATTPSAPAAPAPEVKAEAPKAAAPAPKPAPAATSSAPVSREAAPAPESDGKRVFASPLAKKLAADKGFNIAMIPGSGEHGRVVKRDVEAFVPQPTEAPAVQATASAAVAAGVEGFRDEKVSQMRKTIANRLSEAKFTAPHFYLTVEIDMDQAIASRKSINEFAAPTKVSFNDMVIKAASVALKQHPYINASWQGDKIVHHDHVHMGVAVAVPDGLLVPVVRFADTKPLSAISAEVKDLAGKAKDKKLQPSDWEGSTFTISNLGMFGIESFTGIINPPNACIMAVSAIKQVPVVKNGQVVPGNVMKVTMSCDHRVVDGAVGAQFLQTFKSLLEDPVRILV
ncbi:pyruvate dehydrogenase complex dihydrolipoamide acetyltransferase [Sediminitomix flava]|uniref:Acetyltransferase component of pyruvate dehydrogenase complex n=1 Tax=Sediminitomix flava TaxID=379075 RepID=A0A315ZJR2_SEDFL|nr:pyruvate dehydrogenase complex dihydrolipoamide acetyltransferase [Sediminitomix flava]PWJ45068.1 pyruvate dehydrogenase E2 component (dihydrolipoamide acetyltransferase) [Sediminitomix flava]